MIRVSKERFVYHNEINSIGFCDVDVFQRADCLVVIFTEVSGNPGPSVTNAIECIVGQFCKEKDINLSDMKIIERYASHPCDLDLVIIDNNSTSWKRLTVEESFPILMALNG